MGPLQLRKLKFLALVSGVILVLDQASKAWILATLPLGGGFAVIPGHFDITHVHNPGGAFGFLATMSAEVRALLFVAVSVAAVAIILVFYWQTPLQQRATAFGLALVLGGAIGNLVDRVRFGVVIDFLDLYIHDLHWPAFNVADSAIVIGALLLISEIFFAKSPNETVNSSS